LEAVAIGKCLEAIVNQKMFGGCCKFEDFWRPLQIKKRLEAVATIEDIWRPLKIERYLEAVAN
jgi:hypothetical protein